MDIYQETVVKLCADDISFLEISIPYWEHIAEPPANRGFVRHGVRSATSYLGAEIKPSYAEHARPYLLPSTSQLLLWGTRNSAQNLLLPIYDVRRKPTLLRRVDEPWNRATYCAFLQWPDGTHSIDEVRFSKRADGEAHIEVRRSNGFWQLQDVVWAVVGQPLLRDYIVTPIFRIAACTYDLRHVFHLRWESHQDCERDARIHDELMEVFMDDVAGPVETRAARLAQVAERHSLCIETGYLHSSIGLSEQGVVTLVARHGSLTMLGEAQLTNGARRAILLDNGGSVGYALFTGPEAPPAFFGNATYFRPKGHALFVAGFRDEYVERPFRNEHR